MGSWSSSFDDKQKDLLEVIREFINAPNTSDARQILEQHPELLSAEADSILTDLNNVVMSEKTDIIQGYRKILDRCREVGIPQAFEEISRPSNERSENFKMLMEEIRSLSRPQDMQRKVTLLQNALSKFTRHADPIIWTILQIEFGNCLLDNTQGKQTENIEQAIEHYKKALDIFESYNFPVELWALIHYNLANAYSDRILGDKAENFEKAIEHYNQALLVYTQKDFSVNWAGTKINLGAVYRKRIRGDKAENIEHAIEHYNEALKVYTLQDFSINWATTHYNLGNAYNNRFLGDKAENIEQAIEHYNQALLVRTQKDFPVEWAKIQNYLGFAYCNRIQGEQSENVEQAIEHYNQALLVHTQKDFPVYWAGIQNNLGNSYHFRILGDKAENIEKAIEHYNQALKVRTKNDLPEDWAVTQNNLASVYSDRILGGKAENFEKAIEHYNHALSVQTQKESPVEWASTQINLANAYRDRILGDREENIDKAINHCHSALKICKLESMPNYFRIACRLLGNLYFNKGQWEDALQKYIDAIKADDILYRAGLSVESKTFEVKENVTLYQNATMAACHMDLARDALIILDRGKTRLLGETMRLKMKKPAGILNEEWIKYEKAAEKYRTATKPSDRTDDYIQREMAVKKSLEELDAAIKDIQIYMPRFQRELCIFDILSVLDEETALLTFCITDNGSIGFVISRLKDVQYLNIPDFKTEDINCLLFKTDEKGYVTSGWIGDYISYQNASDIYKYYINKYEKTRTSKTEKQLFETYEQYESASEKWKNTINDVLSSVGTKLLYPLLEKLPSQIKRLIFLPFGDLFLLPLHAVPLSDGELLCQRYCISYAPSISLLMEMKNKVETVEGEGIYEVINPEEDPSLVFSECEGKAISKFFHSPLINVGETGTVSTVMNNVPGKAYLHFSCHGSYNWNDPLQSGLRFVEGLTLSLSDLQSDIVDMSSARLVTLSACETGITDIIKSSAEEFVGLPAGFMLAGVPCIVSSLWSVPDISTAILMERFYSNHIVKGMHIPMALKDAQLWVRDLTSNQVANYVEKCYSSGNWEGKSKEYVEQYREHYRKMSKKYPKEKPFRHPYYWAAFTIYGL